MKIFIVNKHPINGIGGSEVQCDLIARELTKLGHKVIFCDVGKKKRSIYPPFPYEVVQLRIEKVGELKTLIKKEKPDVVYWRYNKNYFYRAVLESKNQKVPFVFAVSHANDLKKYSYIFPGKPRKLLGKIKMYYNITKQKIVSRWNFQGFKLVDAIIFQLDNQKKKNFRGIRNLVIPNSASYKKKPFDWGNPYCLWVANLKPRKQPEVFINLASKMAKNNPELDFLMIGPIKDNSYKTILEKAKKIPNFFYLGFQNLEVVNGALQNALCLILTCKPEGFPNVLIQAWMQGCPTISYEYDPDNLIKKEKLGFISPTIKQMEIDIKKLLLDEKLRKQISEKAISYCQNNFSKTKVIKELENFLKDVVKG